MPYKIPAVGEVLWDLLPSGKQLGGAPANFTFHCRSLGADAGLVTRVGDDDFGRRLLAARRNAHAARILETSRRTGGPAVNANESRSATATPVIAAKTGGGNAFTFDAAIR